MSNARYKLHALRRMREYLSLEKAKMLGKAFASQFNYATLTWCSAETNCIWKCRRFITKLKIHQGDLSI